MKQGKNLNQRETTALGNRPRQQPPQGETRCRTRPTLQNTNNQVRLRSEDHDQSTNHRNRSKRTQHHRPSGPRGIRELCRQGLRQSKWNPNTAKSDTKTGPDHGWERGHQRACNPRRQVHLTIIHHEEDIRLHCIKIGNAPIILGLPWLKLHDLVIGWKNHTVKFYSDHCAEKCLPSSPRANMVREENATEHYYRKTPENWEIGETDPWEVCQTVISKIKETSKTSKNPIPPEYHEFLEVFTEKEPTAPLPHRPYDHNIPLEEGKAPPYEPLRPLNEEKMKALKEYLEVNEKRKWIRASTSRA